MIFTTIKRGGYNVESFTYETKRRGGYVSRKKMILPVPIITFDGIQNTALGWLFTWTAAGPVDIWLYNAKLETALDASEYLYVVRGAAKTPPPLEVLPTGAPNTAGRDTPIMVLQWYRVECNYYDIEVSTDAGVNWQSVGTLEEDPLVWVKTFETEILNNHQNHLYRVSAISDNKRESDVLPYEYHMARHPDPPTTPELACVAGELTVN